MGDRAPLLHGLLTTSLVVVVVSLSSGTVAWAQSAGEGAPGVAAPLEAPSEPLAEPPMEPPAAFQADISDAMLAPAAPPARRTDGLGCRHEGHPLPPARRARAADPRGRARSGAARGRRPRAFPPVTLPVPVALALVGGKAEPEIGVQLGADVALSPDGRGGLLLAGFRGKFPRPRPTFFF